MQKMTCFTHFELEIATVFPFLFISFGIIFPFGFACTGTYNSVYFAEFLIFSGCTRWPVPSLPCMIIFAF